MDYAIEREMKGPAFTAMVGEQVLGCAGIMVSWKGMGTAWVVLSDDAATHGVWITRMVRAFMGDIIKSLELRRVEAVVLADSPRNLRWIRYLGFTPENSIAQMYTQDGRDVVRFELITENLNGKAHS